MQKIIVMQKNFEKKMLLFENWTLTNFINIAQYLSIKKVAFLFLYYQNEPKNEQ